jgi:hypothetical protein
MAHFGGGAANGARDDAAALPAFVGVTDDGGEERSRTRALSAAFVAAEAAFGVIEVVEPRLSQRSAGRDRTSDRGGRDRTIGSGPSRIRAWLSALLATVRLPSAAGFSSRT